MPAVYKVQSKFKGDLNDLTCNEVTVKYYNRLALRSWRYVQREGKIATNAHSQRGLAAHLRVRQTKPPATQAGTKISPSFSSLKSRVQLFKEILFTYSLYLQYHRFSKYYERFQTLTEWHWWRLTAAAEHFLPECLLWCPEKMHRMNRCLTGQFFNTIVKNLLELTRKGEQLELLHDPNSLRRTWLTQTSNFLWT